MAKPHKKPTKEQQKRWRATWREKHPEKFLESRRAASQRRKEKAPEKYAEIQRAVRLKRMYGIDRTMYAALLEASGGVCPICKVPFFKSPHIDHDHSTGKVRSLLCGTCNDGLGKFKDNIQFLQSAIEYLKKHGKS